MCKETRLPPNKDDNRDHKIIYRKIKGWKDATAQLVNMMKGEKDYQNMIWGKGTRNEERTALLTDLMNQLQDPQFVLEWLTSVLHKKWENNTSTGCDVEKAESALQELRSALYQSNNTAPNQDRANHEIHESNQLNQNGVIEETEASKAPSFIAGASATKTPSSFTSLSLPAATSMNEELDKILEILEQKNQSTTNLIVYDCTGAILQCLAKSCSDVAQPDFENQYSSNQVQGSDGVGSVTFEREKGQLTLNFPPTLVHNEEMISEEQQSKELSEEQQSKELTLTIRSVAGRVAQLKLAKPEMFLGTQLDPHPLIDEGVGYGFLFYNYECNGDWETEIHVKYPNFKENFRIANPELKFSFMNLLSEMYAKIKREQEILEKNELMIQDTKLNDLQSMIGDRELDDFQLMIQDMENNGLQLSWLETMLKEVRERKTLVEVIVSHRAKALEAEQQLAKLKKKRRFE